MRFYTKEWYTLMQHSAGSDFKKIPDGDYTDADISQLYEKKLKKEIAFDRKSYNTPPVLLPLDDLLSEENFDPEDWIEEENGQITHPSSPAEVRENWEQMHQQALEEFQARPPFDPNETISFVHEVYLTRLKNAKRSYPAWMTETVDPRLIALDLLPASAYDRYRKEERDQKKEWERINKTAAKCGKEQNIPPEMEEALLLHDAALLSLKKTGKHCQMVVSKDGLWPDDPTPYRRVIFHNAVILEQEAGLRVRRFRDPEGWYCSNTSFLYHELYRTETGYEAHMMFWVPKGLAYLTISCTHISYEDGIKLP